MRSFGLFILAVWGMALAGAQPMMWGKMSPLVRQAAMDAAATWRRAADSNDQRRIMAFVCMPQQAADRVLAAHGCRKWAVWGDIAIADIPLQQLRALAAEPMVRRIEAGRHSTLLMDTTLQVVNALPAIQPSAAHDAFTGDGVVVGLVDIGFDLTHPNFRQVDSGRCRISAFWDQLSADTVGSSMPVGRDFIGPTAVLAQGRSTDGDTQYHGTHTLGSAVGGGGGTPWRGLAVGSDICLVSNAVIEDTTYIAFEDRYKYTTATDALGFKYILDYARRQGQPCVVSFSEGYCPYMDQEDSLFAAVLDSLSGPGNIIVASAGNMGLEKTYFEKTSDQPEAGAFVRCFRTEAFYSIMTDGPIAVTLYGYGGEAGLPTDTLSVEVPDMPADTIIYCAMPLSGGDTLQVQLYREQSRFTQHDICQLYITSTRPMNRLRPLALVTSGEGCAEVYGTTTSAFADNGLDGRWHNGCAGRNVMAPACFPSVLCVGATAHRMSVTNADGIPLPALPGSQAGLISTFSSTGPAMNGLMKPDVAAPGVLVVSSLSHYCPAGSDVVHYTYDDDGTRYPWGASTGTSMSAPVVAGAIALWLQACPTLTVSEVRSVLSRTCRHPEPQLSYPNNIYGYGEIDVYRGLLDILGMTSVGSISKQRADGVQVWPVAGGLRLSFTQSPSGPVALSVYDLNGICRHSVILDRVPVEGQIVCLPPMAAGIYAVQIDADGRKGSVLIKLKIEN